MSIEKLSKKRIDLKSLLLPLYKKKLLSIDSITIGIKKLFDRIYSLIEKFKILKISIVSAAWNNKGAEITNDPLRK